MNQVAKIVLIWSALLGAVAASRCGERPKGPPVPMVAATPHTPPPCVLKSSRFANWTEKREYYSTGRSDAFRERVLAAYRKLAKSEPSADWHISTELLDYSCDRAQLLTRVRPNSGFPPEVRFIVLTVDVDEQVVAATTE